MSAALDPTLFESDPFSDVLDAFATKLEARTDPYGGKFLNSWMDDQGGGKLFVFDGDKPVDFQPDASDTPAILMYSVMGEAFEARGEGDRRITLGYQFEGWLHTLDQRVMLQFLWRALAAVGYPWMNPIDPVARVDFVNGYWPSGPIGGMAFPEEEEDEGDVCVWKFKIVVEFAGALMPMFRPS